MTLDLIERRGPTFSRILGVDFFSGNPVEAIERMRDGGLLVVPSAPALALLAHDEGYREAILDADLTIPDSAFMVLMWGAMEGELLRRLSGLEYFDNLVLDPEVRLPGNTLYVMAREQSARKNEEWLQARGITLLPEQIYIAPMYSGAIADEELLERVEQTRPKHIVVTIAGGIQERLGLYLKRNASYRPAIHCIGAAIAFRSGDQVHISKLADRMGLEWFLRCLWRPQRYVPRYWEARKLAWLLYRYRRELPRMNGGGEPPRNARESSEPVVQVR